MSALSKQGRILVIRGGAIGDFILTLPVFAALRTQFPQSQLHVLGYPHIAQLALAGGVVDEVRSIEARALASFFAKQISLDATLAQYFSQFHVIVSFLYDPDEIFKDNISHACGSQFIVGSHRPDESRKVHATQVFLSALERLAIFDADPIPRLKVAATSETTLPAGRWLALHPGSGGEHKNWPETHWLELVQQLVAQSDWNFLLIGGEAEGQKLERLAAVVPPNRLRLARNLSLPDVARLLQQCDLFVGHDSGITHLAAALERPGLVLWADTQEEIWRPRHEALHLVRKPRGLAVLAVGDVLGRLLARMKSV